MERLNRRSLIILVIVSLILLLGLATFLFLRAPESIWTRTTMPYGDCGDECIDLGSHNFAHAGEVRFYYDKDVDDAVVQWGHCLDSILTCVGKGSRGDSRLLANCVEVSACPQVCQRAFSQSLKSARTAQDRLDKFEEVFLKDGAQCKPEE